MASYDYAGEWMDKHWGHRKHKIVTGWEVFDYVAAVATYHGATRSERKKLREELVEVGG